MQACLAAGFASFGLFPAAHAAPNVQKARAATGSIMQEGQRVAAPFAFLKFCARYPAECAAPGLYVEARDNEAGFWRDLKAVNSAVNREIAPRNDTPGRDIWDLAPAVGDCEDYALTKRSRLIAKGWSPQALTLAIANAPGYGPHVVLVARTQQGDVLLDNLTSEIRPWQQANYYFISRQSSENPRQWNSLEDNNLRASM